jgi:hypothetical protein
VEAIRHWTSKYLGYCLDLCEPWSEDASLPFENILDVLTGSDPSVTDYVLEVPARCLQCGGEINEKTRVEWDDQF